jgi:hypothetical protein
MRRISRKKAAAILAAAAVVVAGAGAAYAYWTAGGAGDGSAATGTNTVLVAVQTSEVLDMGPGDSAQPLSGNFNNPNSGPTWVTSVTASIQSVDLVGCSAADYTLSNAVMTVNAQIPSGLGEGAWSGATIKFNNIADTNQDACKNAVVSIHYAIS